MTDGPIEQIKKFVFKSRSRVNGDTQGETLEIFIPEVSDTSYDTKFSIKFQFLSIFSYYKLVIHSILGRQHLC